MDAACAVGGEHVKVESIAKPTQEELLNRRNAAIKASVAHLKEVENRDVLESQWDRWMAVRKMHSGTRLDGAQRRQLLKFFQIMDADGGGTIDAEELVSWRVKKWEARRSQRGLKRRGERGLEGAKRRSKSFHASNRA